MEYLLMFFCSQHRDSDSGGGAGPDKHRLLLQAPSVYECWQGATVWRGEGGAKSLYQAVWWTQLVTTHL